MRGGVMVMVVAVGVAAGDAQLPRGTRTVAGAVDHATRSGRGGALNLRLVFEVFEGLVAVEIRRAS